MPIFNDSYVKAIVIFLSFSALAFSSSVFSFDVPDNVQAVFDNNGCDACHSGANPSGQLSLDDAAVSEASLVGVVANCSNAGDLLVAEGDVNASVLYQKLANSNIACGGRMPPINNGDLISQEDLAIISNWIVSIGPAEQFGLLTLSASDINVDEDQAEVTLNVNRELGTQGAVSIDYSVAAIAGDSAEEGTDFVAQTGTLSFADGETSQSITISLIDDDVFEGSEVFTVQLVVGTEIGGAVVGEPNMTKVTIIDNELDVNPGTFLFSRVSYDVDENVEGNQLDVTVLRTFGETGEVTVNYETTDSNATDGSDYTAVRGTLIFAEGDRNQTFTIAILDDEIEEESENFNLTLSQPGGGAVLGAPATIQVTINDNDGTVDDGGGDDGGGNGDDGTGGDEGDDTDTNTGVDTTSTEDLEFKAAGSLGFAFLIFLFGVSLSGTRYFKQNKQG